MYMYIIQVAVDSAFPFTKDTSAYHQVYLVKEGLIASRVGIHDFLKKYAESGTVHRRFRLGRPSKITAIT